MAETWSAMYGRLKQAANDGAQSDVTLGEALEAYREAHRMEIWELCSLLGCEIARYHRILESLDDFTLRMARRAFAIGIPAPAILGVYVAKCDGAHDYPYCADRSCWLR